MCVSVKIDAAALHTLTHTSLKKLQKLLLPPFEKTTRIFKRTQAGNLAPARFSEFCFATVKVEDFFTFEGYLVTHDKV